MPMRNNFTTPREDYLDIGPHQGKRFSESLWNTKLLPLAKKLGKLAHVKSVRVSFSEGKGPSYYLFIRNSKYGNGGYVFGIRPAQGTSVVATGRDALVQGSFFQFDSWDAVYEQVKKVPAKREY